LSSYQEPQEFIDYSSQSQEDEIIDQDFPLSHVVEISTVKRKIKKSTKKSPMFATAFTTFDESPVFVEIEFIQGNQVVKSYAFLDSGCQGLLVNPRVVFQNQLTMQPISQEVILQFMDGTEAKDPIIGDAIVGKLKIGDHEEMIEFGVTDTTKGYPFVIGGGWQKFHNIMLDHEKGKLKFGKNCGNHGKGDRKEGRLMRTIPVQGNNQKNTIAFVNAAAVNVLRKKYPIHLITLRDIDEAIYVLNQRSQQSQTKPRYIIPQRRNINAVTPEIAAMIQRAEQRNLHAKFKDPKDYVPEDYWDLLDAFSPQEAQDLPPFRPGIDHSMPIQEGKVPPFGPLYSLGEKELIVLREYIEDNLRKG
jgi:hypothetical protein